MLRLRTFYNAGSLRVGAQQEPYSGRPVGSDNTADDISFYGQRSYNPVIWCVGGFSRLSRENVERILYLLEVQVVRSMDSSLNYNVIIFFNRNRSVPIHLPLVYFFIYFAAGKLKHRSGFSTRPR